MNRTLRKILIFALGLLLSLSPLVNAQAQDSTSGWAVRVSKVATLETPDSMNLKVYFSVFDPKTDLAILDISPKGAQIALPQVKELEDAEFKKPDVPIYIVLLLDASGSMGGAATQLQKAAKLALNNSPDNSFFSVVQFNEDIHLLQDFSQNIQAVSFAIDQYRVAQKGTCLYDATYSAVESLQKAPPGRRAIILFTDGKDENIAGKPCSKHNFLDTSDFAEKSQVPVSTVGLTYDKGNINELELKGIAASTGGYSAIGKQADLPTAFSNIMNGLKAQWMVETNIYPKKGTNQVLMNLVLKDNKELGATFNIESQTDFPGPPSPVQGRMAGLEFKPEDQSYNIQVAVTAPELVDSIKVEVWDSKGGSKVAEYQFRNIQKNNTFNIPTSQLVTGREYDLRMTAISKADQTRFNWYTTNDGKRVPELIHPFVFDPSANLPSLVIESVSQVNNDLVLSVKTTNQQLIGGFNGWLVDKATNTQVPNSSFINSPLNGASGTITIPLSKARVPEGQYTAVINVLGKQKQVYYTTNYDGIAYKPTLPNVIDLLTAALIAAPIVIVLVIFILLGLIGFLMYTSSREKSLSGTPVLQGRLGNRLGAGRPGVGPVIPIADHDPLSARGQGLSAAHPVQPLHNPSAPVDSEATFINGPGGMPAVDNGATVLTFEPKLPVASLKLIQGSPGSMPPSGILVNQTPFIIGRTQGMLNIPDASISRQHAQIDYNETSHAFTITDLKSSNGTRLNNQRINPDQPTLLANGTLIGLGLNVVLRFDLS